MADRVIRVKECDFLPECPTPKDDVLRVKIECDGKISIVDVCAGDRASQPLDALVERAHRKPRRRGIKVTEPPPRRAVRK